MYINEHLCSCSIMRVHTALKSLKLFANSLKLFLVVRHFEGLMINRVSQQHFDCYGSRLASLAFRVNDFSIRSRLRRASHRSTTKVWATHKVKLIHDPGFGEPTVLLAYLPLILP